MAEKSSNSVDLEALADLCTPWCIRVAVTLHIPELIAAGNNDVSGLSSITSCDQWYLHRLLTHLSQKGLFHEGPSGHFELNDASRSLLEPEAQFGLDLSGLGGRMSSAWGTLPTLVKTGAPGYEAMFGLPFWMDLEANQTLGNQFDDLIGPPGHGNPSSDFQIQGGWESIQSVIDVGGGTGAMLAELLRTWPHLTGTLIDLPRTVTKAGPLFKEAGVSNRVRTVAQDFFDELPGGADLYLLRGILNDWPDQQAVEILKRCARAAHPDGRVVVLKGTVPDGSDRGLLIEMVLLGGKQRTVSEFQELAVMAGLEITSHGTSTAGYVIECRPV